MEILFFLAVLLLGVVLLLHKGSAAKRNSKSTRKIKVAELREQIETALDLPSMEPIESWQNEPASEALLQQLREHGVELNRPLTKGQAMNVLGLFSPPDGRQVDILKHFNIPYSFKMNQTMAHYVIRELFRDPQKVAEWNNRPPTSTVRQGLLFMEGKLVNGLTHMQAQRRLDRFGMDNPERYQEWKQIDRLFLEANNPEVRAKYEVRKITWKRFFESYESLKLAGIPPRAMCGENIIEQAANDDEKIQVPSQIREAIQSAAS
ncbi:MAG: hypothetical protein ABW076_06410 [Candidatus Thiodiazotropha sp.]